jgi:VanZ family protein
VRALAVVASILPVLVITLTPMGDRPPLPFSPVIGEGRRWLADGLLNLLLFVPFGFAVSWNCRSVLKTAALGLLLSTAIEIAQLWIPGRDSSLSDILFNTAGSLVGALLAQNPGAWVFPDRTRSRTLAFAALAGIAAIMVVTAILLSPSGEGSSLTQESGEMVLAFPSRADNIGLDAPVYWPSPTAADTGVGPITVARERAHWLVRARARVIAEVGPTVGDGWTLLAYPDAIARRWGAVLSALWMMILCLVIGYWARGVRSGAIAAGAIAILLILLPVILGIARTPLAEWIGAALGLVAGLCLGEVVRRREPAGECRSALSKTRRLSSPAP